MKPESTPPAIVRAACDRREIGRHIERVAGVIRQLKRSRGQLRNRLWPAACRAKSGGATATVYEDDIARIEQMVSEGDTSFENWKRHGGDASAGPFFDEGSSWDFALWRFGSHILERNDLQDRIKKIDERLDRLRGEYHFLIQTIRKHAQ